MVVVLPVPGPPLMIDTCRVSAVAIARRWSGSSTISRSASARRIGRLQLGWLEQRLVDQRPAPPALGDELLGLVQVAPVDRRLVVERSVLADRLGPGVARAGEPRRVVAQRLHQLGRRLPAAGRGASLVQLARGPVDELT